MEPSSSTAVLALTSESIRGHTSNVDSDISLPGDRIVVNENTFIIEADGGIIPIPAGTVATLLPDSDDETAQEKEPTANSCEPDSTSQDITINRSSGSNSPSKLEVSTVPLSVENSRLCENNSKLPSLAHSVAEVVTHGDTSDATVMMSEKCSAAISEKVAENSVPSDESIKDHDVIEEMSQVSANTSIAISDLYVQEEEEVIMDEISADTAAVSNASLTVNSPSVSISTNISDSEESSHNKNTKKTAPKKSVKTVHASQEKAEISECVGAKSVVRDIVTNVQHILLEKTKSMSPAIPAVSASGRPQRSTPRRSAIDLLKGTDAVKPARRSVADAESDGPAAKISKMSVLKKNPEATSISTPVEEKSLSDPTPSRGRPRRKVADSSSLITEKDSDTVTLSSNEVLASVDNKLLDSAAPASEGVKSEANSFDCDEENPDVSKKKNSLADQNIIKMETNCQLDEICKTGNTNGSIEEQSRLHESIKKTPKKTDHHHSDMVVSKEDSVTASSVQRGRPKRSIPCVDTDQKDQMSGKVSSKPDTDKSDPEQDESQHQASLVESDSENADGATRVNKVVCHNNDMGRRSCVNYSTKTSSQPGFPYHSFTIGGVAKKIAEVKSRTKSMKVRHRKAKLVNQIGASKESHKNALDMCQAKLPNIESMQARIRELEAQVERLQTKLDEVGKQDGVRSVDKSKVSSSIAKELSAVSPDLETDEKSWLARWEEKLRKLDMELDEKRTELTIRLGCITRYERQVLEKERRLKRLELNLTLLKQSGGNVDDTPKDVVTVTDVPLLMTGRVDLHAEEHKLELRRQELERQKSFLEDEKKKLVAKERELETREQAAMDADLISMASVFKTSDASLPGHSVLKQSNGKVEVEFSDDEDEDGFGADAPQFASALATAVRLPTPNALSEDDDFSGRDEDISLPKIASPNRKHRKTLPTGDSSVQLTTSTSDSLSTKSLSKRRLIETEEDKSKTRKRAA